MTVMIYHIVAIMIDIYLAQKYTNVKFKKEIICQQLMNK